jgi:NAD(P)-dependent dehydrogenase (short-subunit alcohol dehydrogenase family)
MSRPLEGRVALVAGATRGAGRGIACELGAAGATVYCTGRSVRGAVATPGRSETIEETAAMVDTRGGRGVPVQVDHSEREQVEALVARIRAEQGRLDVLVNDIWGGDALTEFGTPFWELDVEKGRLLLDRAIHTHVVTSRYAAPLLMETGNALIVEVTDGDTFWYRGNLFYDLAKTAVIRLAFAQAYELRNRGVTALAITPGFLRSEAMLDHFGVTEANWTDGIARDANFAQSETPFFVGRAVAALAADPEVKRRSGRVFSSWGLAREYGFSDVDGHRPDWGAYFAAAFEVPEQPLDDTFYAYWHGGPMYTLFSDWP